ncbi:MAG: hypothetical protein ACKPKO_01200 [Candidatus Fonsibacter sp.]
MISTLGLCQLPFLYRLLIDYNIGANWSSTYVVVALGDSILSTSVLV